MVDFNNETTITRPATDILKMTILQRRYETINALGWYAEKEESGHAQSLGTSKVRSSLLQLFYDCRSMLKNRMKADSFAAMEKNILENNVDSQTILELFELIDTELYSVGLTKFDTGRVYDSTSVEAENKEKGL